MPAEGLISFIAATAATTNVTGGTLNTFTGTPSRGAYSRWIFSGASAATAGPVLTPMMRKSVDGTTWLSSAIGNPITLTTTATAIETGVPFIVGRVHPYVQPLLVVTNPAGGGATFTVQVDYCASVP